MGLEEDAEEVKEKQDEEKAHRVQAFDTARKVPALHRKDGCYRDQKLFFKSYETVMENVLAQGSFTTVCRASWQTRLEMADNSVDPRLVSDEQETTTQQFLQLARQQMWLLDMVRLSREPLVSVSHASSMEPSRRWQATTRD